MTEQNSRLSSFPPELVRQIFAKISTPTNMLRLHTVNRTFAMYTESFYFEKIEELHIQKLAFCVGNGSIINGDFVQLEHIIGVVKKLWKLSKNLTSLKLSGAILPRVPSLYVTISDVMISHPRTLVELDINVNIDYHPRLDSVVSCLNGVHNIIDNVSDSLEKVMLSCKRGWIESVEHNVSLEALGRCMRLKEIYLCEIYVTAPYVRLICQDKHLSTITILQNTIPWPSGLIRTVHDHLFSAILWAVDTNITRLYVQLGALVIDDSTLPTNKTFPLLTTLTIACSWYCLLQYSEVDAIQMRLSLLVRYFPAIEYLHIKNRDAHQHCAHAKYILWFFQRILPTLDATVMERKLRVTIFYLSYNCIS